MVARPLPLPPRFTFGPAADERDYRGVAGPADSGWRVHRQHELVSRGELPCVVAVIGLR